MTLICFFCHNQKGPWSLIEVDKIYQRVCLDCKRALKENKTAEEPSYVETASDYYEKTKRRSAEARKKSNDSVLRGYKIKK